MLFKTRSNGVLPKKQSGEFKEIKQSALRPYKSDMSSYGEKEKDYSHLVPNYVLVVPNDAIVFLEKKTGAKIKTDFASIKKQYFQKERIQYFKKQFEEYSKKMYNNEQLSFILCMNTMTLVPSDDHQKINELLHRIIEEFLMGDSKQELNISFTHKKPIIDLYNNQLENTKKNYKYNNQRIYKALLPLVKEIYFQLKEESFCQFVVEQCEEIKKEELEKAKGVRERIEEETLKNKNTFGDLSFRWLKNVETWSIKEVSKWLISINFEEYLEEFENQLIDGMVLVELTQKDLIELGINILGHRMKILRFIKELKESRV